MPSAFGPGLALSLLLGIATSTAAASAQTDDDADALSLTSAPEPASVAAGETKGAGVKQQTRLFVEGAAGLASQRQPQDTRSLGRTSVDFSHTMSLAPGWRAVLSDRLDVLHPVEPGQDRAVNSLREAYVSWQRTDGRSRAEFGRINLRSGPGYGYNPSDFFRDGSLRTLTSLNPFTLRENRLGTVALRGQQLWSGGSLSAAYSPKLSSRGPDADGGSLDLGSTNHDNRGQLVLGHALSEGISGQLLLNKEAGLSPQWGATVTALVTDSAVLHGEWTRSREPDLLARAQMQSALLTTAGADFTRSRIVGGLTYTTRSKLSLTAEMQYNGFALDPSGWNNLRTDPGSAALLGSYLSEAQRRQELASRKAYMLYATQRSLGTKNLDVTALLRVNALDDSRLAWIEARYHWDNIDLALQLQQTGGGAGTEYGLMPYRRAGQLLAVYYFK